MSHYDSERSDRRWTIAIGLCIGTAMVIMSVLVVMGVLYLQ